jgi:23S rRNA-/tRNA-specific pseudouridylate synthase
VHCLDAGTTGAMVVAKSERTYTALKRPFKGRTVEKLYSALVQGHPDPSGGTIDAPIDRHPSSDWKFAVVAGGRATQRHPLRNRARLPCCVAAVDQARNRTDAPDPGAHGGSSTSVLR